MCSTTWEVKPLRMPSVASRCSFVKPFSVKVLMMFLYLPRATNRGSMCHLHQIRSLILCVDVCRLIKGPCAAIHASLLPRRCMCPPPPRGGGRGACMGPSGNLTATCSCRQHGLADDSEGMMESQSRDGLVDTIQASKKKPAASHHEEVQAEAVALMCVDS